MLNLVICVVLGTWWALSYRLAAGKKIPASSLFATACGTAFVSVLAWSMLSADFALDRTAALIGMAAGAALFIDMSAYFALVRAGARVGASWTIISLAMIIPVTVSILLWDELPTLLQMLGLVASITAICMLGRVKTGRTRFTTREQALLAAQP